MTIPTLIKTPDGIEIVRDKIAQILATELAAQRALALAENEDPDQWRINVYVERANPFEQWLNDGVATVSTAPICNVAFDSASYPQGTGNVVGRQKTDAVYNLDCYGFAFSKSDGASGHIPGDRGAAFEAHRAVRLVRNILMAAEYTYLGLRGTVWQRWIDSVLSFQPEFDGRRIQHIVGARIAFRVAFNDFSPQVAEETLEQIYTTIRRAEDDQILVEVDVDFTE